MPGADSIDLTIRQIALGDKLTGLSLGNPKFTPLKTFLQRHAHAYERYSLARTYAAFNTANGKVLAYVILVCGEVHIDDGDERPITDEGLKFLYNQYPAVKIARLAVDKSLRGSGIGRALVELALGVAKDTVCPAVGCRFMMVDSKQDSIEFYAKCGFTTLDTADNRERDEPVMYIDLGKVVT